MISDFISKKFSLMTVPAYLLSFCLCAIPSSYAKTGDISGQVTDAFSVVPGLSTSKYHGWTVKTFCLDRNGDFNYESCYVIATSNNHKVMLEGPTSSGQMAPAPTSVLYIGKKIFRIMTSCGTECNDTLYFSPPNKIGRWFTVLSDNVNNGTVAVLNDNGHSNKINVYRIFSQEKRPLISFETRNKNSYPSVAINEHKVIVTYTDKSNHLKRKTFRLFQ